jgi:hypothetical protein
MAVSHGRHPRSVFAAAKIAAKNADGHRDTDIS